MSIRYRPHKQVHTNCRIWGTQAVGINVFGNLSAETKARLGILPVVGESDIKDDDVTLFMADVESAGYTRS